MAKPACHISSAGQLSRWLFFLVEKREGTRAERLRGVEDFSFLETPRGWRQAELALRCSNCGFGRGSRLGWRCAEVKESDPPDQRRPRAGGGSPAEI